MQNTSNVYTNAPQKGLVTELHENLVSKDVWTFARNAQTNSHLGQIQFIQNEPSNYKCVDLPYTPIGFIKLLKNRWAVFTTDNINSEIGIFEEDSCIYTKLINNSCLNFNTSNLVQGVSKEIYNCSENIYWTDALNPRRTLNLSDIPYKYTSKIDVCKTKEFTDELDCDQLLIEKKVTPPCIETYLGSGGVLKNGSYQFGIAYSINKSRVTEFYSITLPERIWTHENSGQSIDLQISSLDRDFEEYELIVIATHDNSTEYKSLGFYNTSVSSHHITNINRPEYTPISLDEIINLRPRYSHADIVTANDQYLLWGGMRTNTELDYQLKAMSIEAEYLVLQVPSDYYSKGGKLVGYNRGESYAFGIQWLDETGQWSPIYHIGGRRAKGEKQIASGSNVFESKLPKNCRPDVKIQKWMVENTATDMAPLISNIYNCDGTFIGSGKMGYMDSTIVYPDNIAQFGKDACTPVRHHMMPDNCKTHIHTDGGDFINILSVRFKNIEHPKDKNGNPIQGIVGYRILRGNRENNKTVIAKGICTNMRSYKEDDIEVLYPNYPYNSLMIDPFLSKKEVFFKGGKEKGYSGLDTYKTDKFSFYSPETLFNTVGLGDEMNFLTEEIATVSGKFEIVNKHPKQKLLTEFDVYFALIIGAIDGYLSTRGKRVTTKYVDPERNIDDPTGLLPISKPRIVTTTGTTSDQELTIVGTTELIAGEETVTGTTELRTISHYEKANADHTHIAMEQYANDTIGQLNSVIASGSRLEKVAATLLKTLASVGMFAFFAAKAARETLDTLYEVSSWQDYVVQYNSHGTFDTFQCIPKESRRRGIDHYQYLYDGINTVEGVKINNFKRSNNIYIHTSDDIATPKSKDTTLITLEGANSCDTIGKNIKTNAVAYYTAIKRRLYNQYGQIDSVEYQDTNGCIQLAELKKGDDTYTSDPIFGGDTFICKFAVKDSMNYFSQYLYDTPNGFIYDYRTFRNVAHPRYWMDSTPYDVSEFVSANPTKSNLPKNKHNLSCPGNNSFSNLTVVKNRYMYLTNNSVKEFFVETEMNLDYRDWKGEKPTFYSKYSQDLSTLFKSGEDIEKREEFIYDRSYSKQLTESSGFQQRIDFDPAISETCYNYYKNKVIYSLPAHLDQKADNWKVNLANNFYDFPLAEFGELTAMHPVDNQQIIFLFDKASPYITVGRDEIQLGSGNKVTIGDAGLFAREPKPIVYTDYHYGNSQSKWAFNTTQYGSFYPSQRQGRVFGYTGQLQEVSKAGMSHWFNNYMPSKMLEQFPDFKDYDNPVKGVGLISVFDNTEERYYLTKRDYTVKNEFKSTLKYDNVTNTFRNNEEKINFKDPQYFDDASWTISYSPKDQAFISWHDWHPDWTLQTEKHFMTVRDGSIWKHNDTYDSFCKFYGKQYPFSLEYLINNGQSVDILRSLEYYLEAGKYHNDGRDFHQILDLNFDFLTVSNAEQISGNLNMNLQPKNNISAMFNYPKIDVLGKKIDILYNKEEQKYRVNQFWDITKDRGEFSELQFPLWLTEANGYVKNINEQAINLNKVDWQRKKFRNMWHKILLTKTDSGENKFIFKFGNSKQVNSFR